MKRLLLPVCLLLLAFQSGAQESARQRAVSALVEYLTEDAPTSATFVEAHVAESLRAKVGAERLTQWLDALRAAVQGASLDDLFPDGEHGACLVFQRPGDAVEVLLRIAPEPPNRIVDLWIDGKAHLDPDAKVEPLPPPLTWDNLGERLAAEETAGFAGALLIVRDGEIVWNEGYGLASREKSIRNTPETIFAIGSTPIDFTKAAILLLAQDELLGLDQPITDFFDDVPEDKRATTVRHLMTGGSGLQDFHGAPGDTDPDHFWIDRAECIRRILAQELLFAPGAGRQHSHSAWGLLAAIVEIVSETSYQDFTRELLFEPAGMESTGFNGDPVPEARLAVGYGELSDGKINAPPFWGETSWLVMGSGGMVSTTGDMLRWMRAIRSGEILTPETQRLYWSPPGGILAGGDMFGYEIVYTEGPDSLFVLISNAIEGSQRRRFNKLGEAIARLP